MLNRNVAGAVRTGLYFTRLRHGQEKTEPKSSVFFACGGNNRLALQRSVAEKANRSEKTRSPDRVHCDSMHSMLHKRDVLLLHRIKKKPNQRVRFSLHVGELYFQVQHFNKKKSSYKNCCIMKLAKKIKRQELMYELYTS